MRKASVVLMSAAVFALSACAALSPQADAGLTRAVLETQLDAEGKIKSCKADITDGKERKSVQLSGGFCGATFTYVAADVLAFRAHEIRAAVEETLIAETGQAAPKVVSALMRSILGVGALGALQDAEAAKMALEAAKLKAETARALQPGGVR